MRFLTITLLVVMAAAIDSAPALPDGMKYIGCFADSGRRDLSHSHSGRIHALTATKCYTYCRGRHYEYFGLQNAGQCFCGNRYGEYGQRSEKDCNMPCAGDNSAFCGGKFRNSIYRTGVRQNVPKSKHEQYIGCFQDSGNRDLPKWAAKHAMSPAKCNLLCKDKDFAYFGLQDGKECWCGNSYGRIGKRAYSECNMRCTGDKSVFCGAPWKNSVYATGQQTTHAPGIRYIGCFVDGPERDMQWFVGMHAMTPTQCHLLCQSKNYAYFGLQDGTECHCDNSYGGFGQRPDRECNMPCSGDKTAFCGAAWRNSVYSTGIRQRSGPEYKRMPINCLLGDDYPDLSEKAGTYAMSYKKCRVECRNRGFTYYEVHDGIACRCSKGDGRIGNGSNSKCNNTLHP